MIYVHLPWQSMVMASFTLLFLLAIPLLLPFQSFLIRRSDPPLPSRLPALLIAFFPLLISPPVFRPLLTLGAWALHPRARARLRRLLLHPFLAGSSFSTLGAYPLSFSPLPSPQRFHLLLTSLLCSRLFLYLFPSSHPCPCFLRHITLFFSPSSSRRRRTVFPCFTLS